MNRRHSRFVLGCVVMVICGFDQSKTEPPKADVDDGSFGMYPPIACKNIRGYEDYDVLPGAKITSDEKLLVYVLPRHYKSRKVGDQYEAHLTQEGRVRRRGAKGVLWSKPKLLDYKVKTGTPPKTIYLRNTVGLKGLKPGEYDYDLILHDEVGQSVAATVTLPFTVVAASVSTP